MSRPRTTPTLANTFVIDPYTYYDYKESFGTQHNAMSDIGAPSWVGDHWRRLQAYKLLESGYRNAAREWLNGASDDDKAKRREYGDAVTIRDGILSSLLGDDMSIIVRGAARNQAAEAPNSTAAAQLTKLLEWAEDESFFQRVHSSETNAVGLGDGVYVLSWDAKRKRPRLMSYDPGFYFPVLPNDVTDDFPRKVHLAWEYEEPKVSDPDQMDKFVRRLTWELTDIHPHNAESLVVEEDDPGVMLFQNERVTDGQTVRRYPWNEDYSSETVIFKDYSWKIEDLDRKVDDFEENKAIINTPETDLQIDFLPIIHIPNTDPGQDHYGTSCVGVVMQILDDLVGNSTELHEASLTTAAPPIAVAGTSLPKNEDGTIAGYGPGTVWETGEGTAEMIDTSKSLDALIKYDNMLGERLAVNAKVPESLLGKVKPSEVPSGITITLSWAPHTALIRGMRLIRKDKYRLLLRFVSRFFWYNELLSGAEEAFLEFGSFLPSDKNEVANIVSTLMGGDNGGHQSISLETAVRMLVEAGFPIEDATTEVERIQKRDVATADALVTATGDVNEGRKYLGLAPIDFNEPPPPTTETEEP